MAMISFKNYSDPETSTQIEVLLDACRRGDQKAQLQIYKLFCKKTFNICMMIAGDPAEAEYLMQESFLDAFEEISKCPPSQDFISLLLGMLEKRLSPDNNYTIQKY